MTDEQLAAIAALRDEIITQAIVYAATAPECKDWLCQQPKCRLVRACRELERVAKGRQLEVADAA